MARAKQPTANRSTGAPGNEHSSETARKAVHKILGDRQDASSEQVEFQSRVAAQVESHWNAARNARETIEDEMVREQYMRNDKYTAEQAARIQKEGGSDQLYMPVASAKAEALVEWLKTTLHAVNPGERLWGLTPTPIPDLPADVAQEVAESVVMEMLPALMAGMTPDGAGVEAVTRDQKARVLEAMRTEAQERAERMEDVIADQFSEGGFWPALEEAIDDLGHAKLAVIRGPIVCEVPKQRYVEGENGQGQIVLEKKLQLKFHRISQLDVYPAPNSTGIGNRYLIYRMRLTDNELYQLRYASSNTVNTAAIDDLLINKRYSPFYHESIDSERDQVEERETYNEKSDVYEILEYWGQVHGSDLLDWGVKNLGDEAVHKMFHVQIWYSPILKEAIRITINPSPDGRPLIWGTSIYPVADAFWGRSLMDKARPVQIIVNALVRGQMDNIAEAAKPKTMINDWDRLEEGEDPTQDHNGRIYRFRSPDPGQAHIKPMEFWQMDLLPIGQEIDRYIGYNDENTGIPKIITGSSAPGTASGAAMLLDSAGKKVRNILAHIDIDIITAVVTYMYHWNMMFNPDSSIKGDAEIIPKGVLKMVRDEGASAKAAQLLPLAVDPVVPPSGRANLWRNMLDGMNMDVEAIMPREHVRLLEQQDRMMDQMGMGGMMPPGPGGDAGDPEQEESIGAEPPQSVTAKPNTPIETPQPV